MRPSAPTPAISVLVPCFNLGAYVEETIASVQAQTRQDFEIIVVNDGSTDERTNRVLAGLKAPKTTVITTPNRGLAAARNEALARAQGLYVCALDADDLLTPEFLARTSAVLDAEPRLSFVSTWFQSFGTQDDVWRPSRCDLPMLLAEDTVLTASLVRRAAVLDVGGFDGGMGAMGYEDWELWLSLVERGYEGAILPEPLFRYRRRANSMFTECTRDPTHLRLLEYMMRKHAGSYRANALEVLSLKDAELARLRAERGALSRELDEVLQPQVNGLEAELARLEQRRATVANTRALEGALEEARGEVQALRRSLSWRLTGPLRTLAEQLGLAPKKGAR